MSDGHPGVAIVTGAGGGIGAAVARKLAARGFTLAAVDLRESWCRATFDATIDHRRAPSSFGADLRFLHEVEATVSRVVESLGPPAVVVNAPFPGRPDGLGPVGRDETVDWESVMLTRLRAPLLVSRAAERYLIEAGYGRIVHVTELSGVTDRRRPVDLVVREGLHAITGLLSRELGPRGVSVNTVVAEIDHPNRSADDFADDETVSMVEFLVSDAMADISGRLIETRCRPTGTSPPGANTGR